MTGAIGKAVVRIFYEKLGNVSVSVAWIDTDVLLCRGKLGVNRVEITHPLPPLKRGTERRDGKETPLSPLGEGNKRTGTIQFFSVMLRSSPLGEGNLSERNGKDILMFISSTMDYGDSSLTAFTSE